MKFDRLVLCRPEGGLNDVLCQIEKVCKYAEQFDRSVIIDTNHHSTGSIRDHFSRYFVSRQKRVFLDLTAIEFKLKNVSVVPSFIASDLLQYDAHFDRELGYFVEKNTRQPITFDFTKNYAEPLLVHHASGRLRGASVAALSRLRLHDNLADELTKRLKSIGSNYVSVHIRNTDYKTNYQVVLNQLRNHPALRDCENLFVATDDIACLEACKNKFPDINIISFSKLPEKSGRPIHRLTELDDVYQRNKDAILDLLMLALSHKFIFFELQENRWSAKYSGFSILALDLRNSRAILSELISRPDDIYQIYRRNC
jgi:hypothetical protein